MNCDDIRSLLEEYHDRELDPSRAEGVRAHVAACAGCAAELRGLERLDQTLRGAAAPADVAWDRYVDQVRSRVRASRGGSWKAVLPLAAAAALVFAFARALPSGGAPAPLLDRYAAAGPGERLLLEKSVDTLNRAALSELALAMVADRDPERRRHAARLLSPKLNDPALRRLLLDRSRELEAGDREEAVLIDLGVEPGDEELVVPALEMARSPSVFADAIRILRRLDRGTLNRKAHSEIVGRLRQLLASDLPRERELAVRIAGELEILMEDLVEFLDVPELGARVLEFLRRHTNRDFGTDKARWRAWFAQQSGRM